MSESTAVAESSSAPIVETVELPRSGTSEYAEWRISGDLPEPKPKEVSAPSTEEKVELGEATTPNKPQENRRRPDAEARIKELAAENKRIKAELEASKSKPAEQTRETQQPAVRTKPTSEDKSQDGKPKYATYEDFVEDLADWKAEQRMAASESARTAREQQTAFNADVEKARSRYENFDETVGPAANSINDDPQVNGVVKAMLRDSEVLPDLLYTIGSSQEDLAAFVLMAKSNPGKAIRYLAVTENLIREELDKGSTGDRNGKGQFVPKTDPAPAKRGSESAPEPPLEVGNRGAGAMDESGRALSAIERGDPNAVRAWIKAENAKDLRRRRGV